MKEANLVHVLNHFLKENNFLFANEVRMGIGIPDVMIGCCLAEDHQNILDYYVLKMYDLLLENNITTINDAVEVFSLPRSNVLKYIQKLENEGLINIEGEEITIKHHMNKEGIGTSIAIEAKIKDWKNGLLQAQRYLNFSDYVYVAIQEKFVKNVEMEKFVDKGIGLLAVSEDEVREVLGPIKSTECDFYFKYISLSSVLEKNGQEKCDCVSPNFFSLSLA